MNDLSSWEILLYGSFAIFMLGLVGYFIGYSIGKGFWRAKLNEEKDMKPPTFNVVVSYRDKDKDKGE